MPQRSGIRISPAPVCAAIRDAMMTVEPNRSPASSIGSPGVEADIIDFVTREGRTPGYIPRLF
jgi:hypothetical protein